MARTPLIAGNWKMNLNHLEAIALVQKLAFALPEKYYDRVEVAVLPPFTDIRSVQTLIDGDRLKMVHGAQDLSPHDSGAYTGDVSGAMLAKLGCRYVLVGHSERREIHGEDDATRQPQGARGGQARDRADPLRGGGARRPGGGPPRRAHHGPAARRRWHKVSSQHAQTLVIAYEPVWAIGTGRVASAARRPGGVRARSAQAVAGEVRRDDRRRDPRALRRLGEGRATSARSSGSPTSTARSSAGPAWTPTGSPSCARSPRAARCRRDS